VFDTLLSPDPSKGQYTPSDDGLEADACLMFVAGTDTTSNTLVQGTYHVLSDPSIHAALKKELHDAMPNHDSPMLSWQALENLPYLRGVVKESLRFAYGVPGRVPRVVPAGGATLAGRRIPEGTSVAAAAYTYHTLDTLFPDALAFRPERWIDEKGGQDQELESKLLSFSKGPRGCLGMK
jgi:cytochrome P450